MDTDALLDQAAQGDSSAVNTLLTRHAARLRAMVALRIDARLAPRLDPSDVVQEALAEAHRKMPAYLDNRAVPFYPWLRKIAWEKLVHMHRRHVYAQRRSVRREAGRLDLSGDSKLMLVDKLAASSTGPGDELARAEMLARVTSALAELPARDHEIIVLKHLEYMTFVEAAAVLDMTEEAVRSRYRRAIERVHKIVIREQ
jgi:RNA polymerase sigma-70 factor (ECF subfamily)